MITLAVRLKNLAFLLVAVLALSYLGIRYADLGRHVGVADHYTVEVRLPRTGGLFTHADITYRGVSVGRVGPIGLTDDGVVAELRIKNSVPRIPADTKAVVAGLSAVGEQYVDLRPESDGSPYLTDGARIEQTDTQVPAPVTDVLASVDDLVRSVPQDDLRTVVDELGTAFEGHGDDLQVLLDSGSGFVRAADRALPSTTLLIHDGETVLRTQAQEGEAIRGFATGAEELARALKGSDADLRRLLAVTPVAATQVSGVLRDLDPSLGVVLANLLTTAGIAVTRQRGIEELLVTYPAGELSRLHRRRRREAEPRHGRHLLRPPALHRRDGATRYRNGHDLGTAPPLNTGAAFTAPASTGVNAARLGERPEGRRGAATEPGDLRRAARVLVRPARHRRRRPTRTRTRTRTAACSANSPGPTAGGS
ncbi:hypothetical protein SALBM217S_07071 [Streptomyces griseoloalbus]